MKTLDIIDYVMWGACIAAIVVFALSNELSKFAVCLWPAITAIWVLEARISRKRKEPRG